MGGIGDFLFGGSSDAKQVGTTTPNFVGPSQELLWNNLVNLLNQNIGKGVTPYEGSTTAGTQPLQNLSFDMIQNLLSQYPGGGSSVPQTAQGGNVLSNILSNGLKTDVSGAPTYAQGASTLDSLLQNFDPEQATKMWKSSYVDPAMKTWKEDIAPQIKESYIARNAQYSSAMPKALANSGEALAENLNSTLGNILYNSSEAQKNRQQTGVNQALQYAQLPLSLSESAANRQVGAVDQSMNYGNTILNSIMNEINTGLTGGAQQYNIANTQAQGAYNQWLSAQPYSNPWLQYLGLGLQNNYTQPIVQGPTQSQGLLSSMLPGIGKGIGSGIGNLISG